MINGTFTYDSQFKSQFSLNHGKCRSRMVRPRGGSAGTLCSRHSLPQRCETIALPCSDENKVTTEILTNPGGGGGGGGNSASRSRSRSSIPMQPLRGTDPSSAVHVARWTTCRSPLRIVLRSTSSTYNVVTT